MSVSRTRTLPESSLRTALRATALLIAPLAVLGPAAAEKAPLAEIEENGRALYAKDRAAWLATDRLLEHEGPTDGILGWLTVPAEGGWRVLFVEQSGDAYCSRTGVLVGYDGAGPLRRQETCEALTAEQRAMFLARQTALSAPRTRCSANENTVVLPSPGADAGWVVYVLAATQEPRTVMVGGHARVLVGEDGREIVDVQPLSAACLKLRLPASDDVEATSLVVTHVLDDHPVETHVFLSLLHGLKFYVLTESAMWEVADGRIRLLMDGEEFEAYLDRARRAAERNRDDDGDAPQ